MSTALTNPVISLLYLSPVDSWRINTRFHDVRQPGIYSGIYPSYASGISVTISGGVFEIRDSGGEDYQVKIANTEDTTIDTAVGKYLVLTWTYTGDEDDDIPYVDSVDEPGENELVIAKVTGTVGNFTFSYNDFPYQRSQPNTLDLNLKVVADSSIGRSVRVRSGYYSAVGSNVFVAEQTCLFDPETTDSSYSRIDLVYLNSLGGVIVAKGTPSTNPAPPSYTGKTALAEVTLTYNYTTISDSDIKDVRSFINTSLLDEDDFGSNSDTKGATQQSIKEYVKNYIGWHFDGVTSTTAETHTYWQEWDLSSVVGTGNSILLIHQYYADNSVNRVTEFKPASGVDAQWHSVYGTTGANKVHDNGLALVHTTNGKIEYRDHNFNNNSFDFTFVLIAYVNCVD